MQSDSRELNFFLKKFVDFLDVALHFLPVSLFIVEILEYAGKLGIDPQGEKHLLHLAREGLLQKLPPNWKPW